MFLKVKDWNWRFNPAREIIINTEQICYICSIEDGKYGVQLSSNTSVEVSKEDAQKIFNAIGVSL